MSHLDLFDVGVPCFKENQNTVFESENRLNANLFYITKNFNVHYVYLVHYIIALTIVKHILHFKYL